MTLKRDTIIYFVYLNGTPNMFVSFFLILLKLDIETQGRLIVY